MRGVSSPQQSPVEHLSTPVDGVAVVGSLSPRGGGDFTTCPLLYRFRSIDRLPEPPSPDAARGTVVHRVLERLFDLPAAQRTPAQALALVEPSWQEVREAEPELAAMFAADGADRQGRELEPWLASCRRVLERYFTLEDPRRLEPADREVYVESVLDSKLLLRGIVDRIDVAPDGAVRLVDYKTGKAPREGYEGAALFQLRFYALVVWRTRGVVPAMLKLVYLGSGEVITYEPDEQDLRATERKVEAIWRAIGEAEESGEWLPRRGPLCGWCAHQALCPAWGGTPPPLPDPVSASGDEPAAADQTVVRA